MQFQRDPIQWQTPVQLCQSIAKYIYYRLTANASLSQWQTIKMADSLRVLRFNKIAALLAAYVTNTTDNPIFKFWSLHVQAVAKHYANDYPASERLFLLAQSYADSRVESFNYQHYGKMLVEAGRLEEAKVWLQKALEVREHQGEPKLIASSQRALSELDQIKKSLFKRSMKTLL